MKNRLQNKVIIITGGSGLLGTEFIKDTRKNGAIVINSDVNHQTDLDQLLVYTDITSKESIDETIRLVLEKYGRIDGLVNNAYPRTKDWGNKFEDIDLDSWKTNVDMQLNSYFYFSQQVLKIMKEQKSGSVINITSIYGVVGNDFTVYEGTELTSPAAYSAIKGGLINFSRYLASYFGKYNVRINCVSPGGIFNHQPKQFVDNYEKKVPMKRLGTPEDISPSVSFLLSEEAKYITGQNLIVDGGWTAI